MNPSFTWPSVQRCLREGFSADDFRTWIRPLRLVAEEQQKIVLEAPNDRFVGILEESYRERIDGLIGRTFGDFFHLEIYSRQLVLDGTLLDANGLKPADALLAPRVEARTTPTAKAALLATDPRRTDLQSARFRDTGSLYPGPLDKGSLQTARSRRAPSGQADFSANPSDGQTNTSGLNTTSTQSTSPVQAPRTAQDGSSSVNRREQSRGTEGTNLPAPSVSRIDPPLFNPKYRFSNFVVGDSNQFACAAARAVAESPGQSYNPLFLYGGVGLGKTHLLHAVGQEIQHRQPHLRVHYISAEQFLNELINSIRFDRMPIFRERYRSIDVLLIDDIQFLANKERTQEEFFHTFNALYTAEKQIILSSDASPKDIPTLEERLRSRFEWGLITDIQPPDLETKIAILRRKAALRQCDLDDEVAMFIAKQVRSNVRELEGLLNRAMAFSSMTGRPLDFELASETLKEILPQADSRRNAAEIIRTVAKTYGLKVSEIKSRNKAKQISFPRQVAMYLCKHLTDLSFPEIGKQFANKHHSTVMHSVDKISKLRQDDSELDRAIERLILQLR